MESDIILDGNLVLLKATDLLLDAEERRSSEGKSPYRRALVHGEGDRLILNYDRDYPAGVTLMGPVRLADLEKPSSSDAGGSKMINMGDPRMGGIVGRDLGRELNIPEPDISDLLEKADRADLIATIKALRRGLLSLDKRLKALER